MERRGECMAILLSTASFEGFFGRVMQLTCEQYVRSYRHDFSFMYARALAALEIDIIIYIPAWNCRGLHQLDDRIYVRFLPLANWYKPWEAFPILGRTPIGRYLSQHANVKAFEGPLTKALVEDKVGVLYIQEYWTARFDHLARTAPVPTIGADQGGRKHRQLTFRKRESFRLASEIICQTENECSQVRSFGRDPLLLPNGIDTHFYCPSEGSLRTQTVLIVARLTDNQKRVSDLICAMRHLPEPWLLQIAGSGPDEDKLRTLAASLGVAARTRFLGFVRDNNQLRNMYCECGVFCLPSSDEGLPLAVLEAMSCGCSVVVTSIRAFDGLVENGNTGYKVPVGKPEQLAVAIRRAWQERERIGIAARQAVVERYSSEAMARRLHSVLQRVGKPK
jgi:glycosyltransferase involved in cell wall biosynthesis